MHGALESGHAASSARGQLGILPNERGELFYMR